MEYNFDIKKIKYSSNFEFRKNELLKFLEFYFNNNRPKNFIKYEKELTKFLPEIMSKMSFDELLYIIPNYYQFYYTITIDQNYLVAQNKILKNLLNPFSKILISKLKELRIEPLKYNLNSNNYWFENLILMFQKEVADRIISKFNSKNYGRLSILSNWKLDIKKVYDVKSSCFFPKPKVQSTVLVFSPKSNHFEIKDPKNLEMLTRIFFSHRRKMIKKPFNQIFNGNLEIARKYNLNLNLRPQNLNFETYYKLTQEFENLGS